MSFTKRFIDPFRTKPALSRNAFNHVARAYDKQEKARGAIIALDAANDKILAGNESIAKAIDARQRNLAQAHAEIDTLLELL